MKYKYYSDCHSHSTHSYDGKNTLTEMCERAKELNLLYYSCTDHCECKKFWSEKEPYLPVVTNSYNEIQKLKEQYPFLLAGIEMAHPLHAMDAAKEALNGRDFDIVIGAIHSVKDNKNFFHQWKDLGIEPHRSLIRYFELIYDLVNWGGFDTLAHIVYPLRYTRDENGNCMNFDPYMEQIVEIYKVMIEKGIALELSTTRLRQRTGEIYPNHQLFKLYRELGGELVTIGSDGHCIRTLGEGLDESMDLLTELGFKYYTVYKERKPIMVSM